MGLLASLGFAVVLFLSCFVCAVLKRQFKTTVVEVLVFDHIEPVHAVSQSDLVHPDILLLLI